MNTGLALTLIIIFVATVAWVCSLLLRYERETPSAAEFNTDPLVKLNEEAANLIDQYLDAQKLNDLNEFGNKTAELKVKMKVNRELRKKELSDSRGKAARAA